MSPVRVQLSRAKGWRMPANTVVVSRPSKFGNPHDWRAWREDWPNGLLAPTESRLARDAWCKERAVQAFQEDLADGTLVLPVEELRGQNVACWCKPYEWCHGDVLLVLANAAPTRTPLPPGDKSRDEIKALPSQGQHSTGKEG